MKKLLVYAILAVVGAYAGWQYLPLEAKQKTSAFVGSVLRGDKEEVKDKLGDLILPENPVERRSVLTEELKNNLEELKKESLDKAGKPLEYSDDAEVKKLLDSSDKLLQELQNSNKDQSLIGKAADKLLDAVLPAKKDNCGN